MAQSERMSKHVRRQSTEDSVDESDPDESGSDDWAPQSSGTIRVGKNAAPALSPRTMSARTRRSAAAPAINASPSSVTVSRSNTPEDRRKSIKLTVKLPSSKLREVMTERDIKGLKATLAEGEYWAKQPEDKLRKRTQKNYKIPEPSDEDEEDDDNDEAGDDEVDEPMNDFAEIGAEAESSGEDDEDADGDADEDADMDETTLPPPPKIKLRQTATSNSKFSKPTLIVTPAATGSLKSVEQKEAEVDPGDEEDGEEVEEGEEGEEGEDGEEEDEDEDLSELNSDDEEQPDDPNIDEEGDGEEDDVEVGEDLDGEEGDIDLDSDGMTPGSGAATPDLAKMTKRQRRDDAGMSSLYMGTHTKKTFTVEQENMRRSEMARRRKNLSEKKVMEEKESTINKLLKKQTAKRRGANAKPETLAAAVAAEGAGNESPGEEPIVKANPLFTRWISDGNGVRLGVPEEWRDKHVGQVFWQPSARPSGRLVEEIE